QTAGVKRLMEQAQKHRDEIGAIESQKAQAENNYIGALDQHAGEDAFLAGIEGGQALPATMFEKAKLAAQAAFDSGYEAGRSARAQGIEMKDGERDGRSFDDLLTHITRNRMLEILNARQQSA